MYEHLSKRVDHVVKLAHRFAREYEQEYVGTEHILLAIANEGTGVGAKVLSDRGATEDRMPFVRETGFDGFHFDSKNDIRRSLALMQGRCRLVGNINNPRTLFRGTVDQVREEVRSAVRAGLTLIGPECALPLACPLENLRAIPQTVGEISTP